ncbi:coiled-coil domain-containing protein 186 isoform X3 [Pieris napi]|uniref:coiled-coil domain-containing protein 186 isoform X3 n=1 Tax=Pieris napi TaxID=78633 RepID=UPI001FBA7483|nr:coiled-coil domain-containing protein 186 isoform X3 [Pieris napi]
MSVEIIENSVHIGGIDDDNSSVKENELSSDSGVDTLESCSVTYPPSSESDISHIKIPESDLFQVESTREDLFSTNESSSPSSLLESISSDNIQNGYSNAEHSCGVHQHSDTDNLSLEEGRINNISVCLTENKSLSASVNNITDIPESSIDLKKSTTSLNVPVEKCNIDMLSRSAENLTNLIESEIISSTDALNTEEILTQFDNQKRKVAATQKIVQDTQPHNDLKSRLPKEILSQDIGSIVRNVHGIFSSVSGSLKSAYNNQRVVQKPTKIVKPVNTKLLSDIFEDGVEKLPMLDTNEIPNVPEIPKPLEPDGDINKDFSKLQIESLERVLAEQRKDNISLREKVKRQMEELQAKDQSFKELEVKVDLMSKRTEQAQREKDAAVMRYASLECSVIDAKKSAENAVKAEKAAIAEKDLLFNKLKTARDEKQRICQMYDDKCHEVSNTERELAKVREEFKELEGRLKWTQSKLRVEMDAYKESTERADKLAQQLTELEAAKEAAVLNAADSLKARQLESELKETQATLILCKHEKEDLDKRLTIALQQFETCKGERDEVTSALSLAQAELERVKAHARSLEEEVAELAALRAQAALADTLSSQLQRETELRNQAETSLALERARSETCVRREAAALEHAAKLTATHVAERARASEHEAKAQALSADNSSLRERVTFLEAEISSLQISLNDEMERRNKETRVLARKVAELTTEAAEANKKLEWEKGEVGVLKKKHASAVKELNRELQRALKRIEQLEAKLPQNGDTTSTRTGSVTSLSSGEGPEEKLHNGHQTDLPDIQIKCGFVEKIFPKTREPDRQALIERIVQLQRAAARRAERCEFLEEHSKQLTNELRGKSRLLRHLLASMPAGAVTSQNSDKNKKEIARLGGGAMAAVWGGDPNGITLELSLEINKKLQAVLEDTLLKNITLKENIDTLGEEISRLKSKSVITK